MNDDRLFSALQAIGGQELPTAADDAIRARLETAWVSRRLRAARASFGLQRFAPMLAGLVLMLSLGGAALGAGADSPLWDTRVALEAGGALLRFSADDRVAYLLELVRSRTEEAARQEVLGNAGAAARARAAASSAVIQLNGRLPQLGSEVVTPTSSPSPTPAPSVVPLVRPTDPPAPSASPTARPAATATRAPLTTTAPAATPVATASPLPTEPVHSPSPSPVSVPSPSPKQSAIITGTVHDSTGAAISDACITTSPTIPTSAASCIAKTTSGSYSFSATITPGQMVTLYASWTSPAGANFVGSATASATVPTTVMPAITLTPRR